MKYNVYMYFGAHIHIHDCKNIHNHPKSYSSHGILTLEENPHGCFRFSAILVVMLSTGLTFTCRFISESHGYSVAIQKLLH